MGSPIAELTRLDRLEAQLEKPAIQRFWELRIVPLFGGEAHASD